MGSKLGVEKIAAGRVGLSLDEYRAKVADGQKWCTSCKAWHVVSTFGVDLSRGDGLAAACLESRHVKQLSLHMWRQRRGWIKATRDGDKRQARARINYLVDSGAIPDPEELPCMDCGDGVFGHSYRHEYDHARGYDGDNQLYVEPVCSKCHHNREDARHG